MADDVTAQDAADVAANSGADQSQGQDTLAAQGNDTLAGEKEVAPDWAADWREKMAGGDEKELKRLQRFKSPVDVYKSARELEKKMSSGDIKAKLAVDATPEQITAWRKENGIPEKPEGYLEKLPSGLVIGDEDKPMLESFLADVHGENAPPAVVAKALDWYYRQQEEVIAAQAQEDNNYNQKSVDLLRAEWGAEYRGNINSIRSFLDQAPATDDGTPLKDLLMGARLSDGTMLGNNPAALKWLATLAQESNPAGFISPAAGEAQIATAKNRIKEIETRMRTDRAGYNKDQAMQDELRKLYDMEAKLASK